MAMGDLHADWVFKENEWLLSMLNMYPQEMRAWALLLALPFCYDTKVLPSVSYMQSGHCDDHKVDNVAQVGRIKIPSQDILKRWAQEVVDCLLGCLDPMGGWSPVRSVVCEWTPGGPERYYKAEPFSQRTSVVYLKHQFDLVCDRRPLTAF